MSPYDWDALAAQPTLRELAGALRETFGVWVGFLDPDGRAIPLGEGDATLEKPICERFKANSVELDEDEKLASCRGSLRRWADDLEVEALEEDRVQDATCHAGLSALLVPISDGEGDVAGAIYASGFVGGEGTTDDGAANQRDGVRRLLERNELLGDLDVGGIPELSEEGREVVLELTGRMRDIVERSREKRSEPRLRSASNENEDVRFEGMLARSDRMKELFETIDQIAETDSTVLIEGENGTGKELVARALHRRSRRVDGRFVALNCAAVPGELIESELFGHKKGAFSGAHRDSEGLCAEAHRGTLFLDEIGDMEKPLQSKLLRFLQDGRFSPVGSSQSRSVDARVLCATNQDLDALVEEGAFRRDLYFRLNVLRLRVPPLRERKEDISLLADHFLDRAASTHGLQRPSLTEDCRQQLLAHDWPGNVRELENEIERLVIMHAGEENIGGEALSGQLEGDPEEVFAPAVEDLTLPEASRRLERTMILEALRETDWNKTKAAEHLDVSRRHVIRKVSEYELEEHRTSED